MSWDGIYRPKMHMRVRTTHVNPTTGEKSERVVGALCQRRLCKRYTDEESAVTCFACLKAMGVIK